MMLKDKIAVITGTGRGIGKSIAKTFAKKGAMVYASSRSRDNGESVVNGICAEGGKAVFIKCDVSKEDDVKRMVQQVIEKNGRIDILVNNAGVNFVKPFEKTEPKDWDRVINTDLRGTYLCSYYCIPHMINAKKGCILNITTVHTKACLPGAAPYDAGKWGIVGLTKSMAVEYADRNIRVNALSPGLIDTQIWDDIKNAAPNIEECMKFWKSNIPMGRVGHPEEIAKTAVFLCSDDASYITGTNILADGGMTSQLISREPYKSSNLEGGDRK